MYMTVIFNFHVLMTVTCTQEPKISFLIHFLHRHRPGSEWLTCLDICTKETGVAFSCQFLDFLSSFGSTKIFAAIFWLLTIDTIHDIEFFKHRIKDHTSSVERSKLFNVYINGVMCFKHRLMARAEPFSVPFVRLSG